MAGFSYGAQRALEVAYESQERIQTLQLISPAFFQSSSEAFRRAQVRAFKHDEARYRERFLQNCTTEAELERVKRFSAPMDLEALETLLWYEWSAEKIGALVARGVEIEVFLGAKDRIIPAGEALAFFRALPVRVFWLKEGEHIIA